VPDFAKGGLFVGAAVVTGIVAGLLAAPFVNADREPAKKRRAHASLTPTMPSVSGERLDEADRELRRRRISYETDAPGIVETVLPEVLEVCDSDPPPGASIRGGARLHVAVAGTCGI
jgi:hypothetical protein